MNNTIKLSNEAIKALETIQNPVFLEVHEENLDNIASKLVELATELSPSDKDSVHQIMEQVYSVMLMRKLIKALNA